MRSPKTRGIRTLIPLFSFMLVVRRGCKEMEKMKNRKELGILLLLVPVLISILIVNGNLPSKAENKGLPKVVFYVSWFDVSEPVLDGLKGVELVNSDFHGSKERTTVWYDPALISIDEMEIALKEVGIYRGTEK